MIVQKKIYYYLFFVQPLVRQTYATICHLMEGAKWRDSLLYFQQGDIEYQKSRLI